MDRKENYQISTLISLLARVIVWGKGKFGHEGWKLGTYFCSFHLKPLISMISGTRSTIGPRGGRGAGGVKVCFWSRASLERPRIYLTRANEYVPSCYS